MISRADLVRHMEQVMTLENTMRDGYRRLHENVSDPGLKARFLELSREEEAHSRIVQGLIDIFSREDRPPS